MKKRMTSIVLVLMLCIGMIPVGTLPVFAAQNVQYIDMDGSTKSVSCDVIASNSTTLGTSGYTKWYAVTGDVTVSSRITCKGDVHLILRDGAKLTAKAGITVNGGKNGGNSLTIYGQKAGTGQLVAYDDYKVGSRPLGRSAAIGGEDSGSVTGNDTDDSGPITINGGNVEAEASVTATFAFLYGAGGAAAIGGSRTGIGYVTINSGNVSARIKTTNQYSGAAIGDGNGVSDGTVNLSWTKASDSIYATNYKGTVNLNKPFYLQGTTTTATTSNIAGKTIVPNMSNYSNITWVKGENGENSLTTVVKNGEQPQCPWNDIDFTIMGWNDGTTTYESKDLPVAAGGEITYTLTRLPYFAAHSLTLDGAIGVNFYLRLTEKEAQNCSIDFGWDGVHWIGDGEEGNTYTLTNNDLEYDQATGFYKASCPVAVAEMTSKIHATLKIGEDKVETDDYSVREYADVVLNPESDFSIACKDESEAKYEALVNLVKKMLDYGAKAQTKFGVNTDNDNLANANSGYSLTTIEDIPSEVSNAALDGTDFKTIPKDKLAEYGLKEYLGSRVLYLDRTTLDHCFTIQNVNVFNDMKKHITFNGQTIANNPDIYEVENGIYVHFYLVNIGAADLGTAYQFTIGDTSVSYSVMDNCKKALLKLANNQNETATNDKLLAMATYYYYQAANAYKQYVPKEETQ